MKKEDQLVALSHLDELFGQHGLEYWLFGGWAVDFHAGKVTLPVHARTSTGSVTDAPPQSYHRRVKMSWRQARSPTDNFDLAVRSRDGERVRELLTAARTANGLRMRSSTMSPRWPGFVLVSSAGR